MGDGSIPTIFFIVFLKPGEKNSLMVGSTALFKKNVTWRHGFGMDLLTKVRARWDGIRHALTDALWRHTILPLGISLHRPEDLLGN